MHQIWACDAAGRLATVKTAPPVRHAGLLAGSTDPRTRPALLDVSERHVRPPAMLDCHLCLMRVRLKRWSPVREYRHLDQSPEGARIKSPCRHPRSQAPTRPQASDQT